MAQTHRSPYLKEDRRLADVVAAIQAMGSYKFYKLTFERWAERISGEESRAEHWRQVFQDHPEFFRLGSDRRHASLVWRRQYPKRYHVDEDRRLTHDEYAHLSAAQKERVSRDPLSANDIQALISTAIDLHSRALERQKEGRWWVPLVTGLASAAGAFIGAVLGKK